MIVAVIAFGSSNTIAQTVACSTTSVPGFCSVSLTNALYVENCPPTTMICVASIQSALQDAASYFENESSPIGVHVGKSYLISIPLGTYDLSNETVLKSTSNGSGGVFDLSGIQVPDAVPPAAQEELVVSGAGSSKTNIITSYLLNTFYLNSRSVPLSHFVIRNAHFGRDNYAATQGTILDVGPGYVTLNISAGFNGPDFGYDEFNNQRSMRLYDNRTPANPKLLTAASNGQLNWASYSQGSPIKAPRTWNIYLNDPSFDPTGIGYEVGSFVCLKNEGASGNFANFNEVSSGGGGADLTFSSLKLTQAGRMKFSGLHNVTINNVAVQRGAPNAAGQAPCLSTDSGGLQFGNSNSGIPTYGNTVTGFSAKAMGDDAVAFFDDQGGSGSYAASKVSASTIADCFARYILINTYGSGLTGSWGGLIASDNRYIDCPVMQTGTKFGVNFTCPIYFANVEGTDETSTPRGDLP